MLEELDNISLFEIITLKFPLSIPLIHFTIIGGEKPVIDNWDVGFFQMPKPNAEKLLEFKDDIDLLYRQKKAVEKRKYPTIGDQLDMIYKDKLNNTNLWFESIEKIKSDFPKPTE